MSAPPWSPDWPTEPGRYWFYGHRSDCAARNSPPELTTVRVRRGGSGLFYVANGAFLHQSEGAQGLWLPLAEPELPAEARIP